MNIVRATLLENHDQNSEEVALVVDTLSLTGDIGGCNQALVDYNEISTFCTINIRLVASRDT